MPPSREPDDHHPLAGAVDDDAEVELPGDGGGLLDVQPVDELALGPDWRVTSRLPEQLVRDLVDLAVAGADLDAAGLAAPAGVDLRLDHPGRAAELLGAVRRLLRAVDDPAARDRHAVAGEQLLGLVLVDVHGHRPRPDRVGRDRVGHLEDRARHPLRGRVDHLAVHGGRAPAVGLGLAQLLDDPAGPVHLGRRRAEHLVGERDLAGVDRPLALGPERGRAAGAGAEAVGVPEVAERSVDRAQPVGPAGDDHPAQREVPLVARVVRVEPADADGARTVAGGVVGDAEVQRLQPAAAGGDGLDVGHAQRRLDQGLGGDPGGVAPGLLDLVDQRLDQVEVGGHADLGHQDGVHAVAGLLHHVDDVAVHVVGVQAVDAHRHGLAERRASRSRAARR